MFEDFFFTLLKYIVKDAKNIKKETVKQWDKNAKSRFKLYMLSAKKHLYIQRYETYLNPEL